MRRMSRSLFDLYHDRVVNGQIQSDPAQEAVLPHLETLRLFLTRRRPLRSRLGLGKADQKPGGIYIWGDVGRGKSMLMDLLLAAVPGAGTRRIHFHAFLQEIHAKVHTAHLAGSRDAITETIAGLGADLRLLALDEMDVSDIADAMLVDRLFRHLLAQGTVIVTTSNRPPEQLYRDGLKRELFLPFIEMLREGLTIIHLQSPQDWRRTSLNGRTTYFTPLDDQTAHDFATLWQAMTEGPDRPAQITSVGRPLRLGMASGSALRVDFADLCDAPLGAGDYLELVRHYTLVFLDGVPILGPAKRDPARRFVMLVDAVYEAKVALVLRAQAGPDDIVDASLGYLGRDRLTSRLAEIHGEVWFREALQNGARRANKLTQ